MRDALFSVRKAFRGVSAIVTFVVAIIVLAWSAAWMQMQTEREASRQASIRSAANLALVLEQSTSRLVSDFDRILKYIRAGYERSQGTATWASLVTEEHARDSHTAQISVIDARGLMVTSSKDLYPAIPLDLSDREHFRVHRSGYRGDFLFVSKPVIGRVSKRQSVQFSRRFTNADGSFGGVIVVSLDTDKFGKTYSNLWLGKGSGFAVIGHDDVIRAGAGVYGNEVGHSLREELGSEHLPEFDERTEVMIVRAGRDLKPVAIRGVAGYPLSVVVSGNEFASDPILARNKVNYIASAGVVTLLAILGGFFAAGRHQRYERKLLFLARHDPLTDLANRTQFREIIDACLQDETSEPCFALLLIDLDGFKAVNDAHGHGAGDRLLMLVAARLSATLRASDHAARLGGDEFAVIQRHVRDPGDAILFAKRLCKLLAQPFEIDGTEVVVGASIGIALSKLHGATGAEIIKAADIALYAMKRQGRGGCRIYDPDMLRSQAERRLLEEELRTAIAKEQFVLHYQPIVSTSTRTVAGYEALLRWQHPERGLLGPQHFIALAEETGLIQQMGRWVLETACMEIARLPGNAKIAVNCSPVQFRHEGFLDDIKCALQRSGLAAERLQLEITESLFLSNDEGVARLFHAVRGLGVKVSLDDFGTGYSSLGYLQNYPVDQIKIDRSFVARLGDGDAARPIIQAITVLAKSLGMRSVAEGVETKEQYVQLRILGCDELQGFLFGKPQPFADIVGRLQSADGQVDAA